MKQATLTQPIPRYKDVTDEKVAGVTYTPLNLANFVANQMVSQLHAAKTSLKILDPAIGEGALLVSLLEKLQDRGIEDIEVYGFETDQSSLAIATERLRRLFPRARLQFSSENFLDYVDQSIAHRNTLFAIDPPVKFDLIIANPPYVRTQVLGADQAQELAKQFGLAGRVDLYYAFILAIGEVLEKDGTAGVIVSNRFMTTKSGSSVRKALLNSFSIKHIWDLGDTKLFDAAVLPAVLLLQQRTVSYQPTTPVFTSIYEIDDTGSIDALDPIEALQHTGKVSIKDGRCFRVQHGSLNSEAYKGDVWRVATETSDSWLAAVKANTWGTFADIGNIRVGIKTCADKVFIRTDWTTLPEQQQPELLRPLTTHHIARRFKPEAQQMKVLYPHTVVGGQRKPIDLNLYPKTKAYLEAHRNILSARSYVIESGRQWYEIWVPQNPVTWKNLKLVFRDISESPTFWIDKEGTVVNGECYWLSARAKEQEELLWLALAVSNSTFIEAFYDHSFNNKLYAGRRRFITQYVERFPLPNPTSEIACQMIELAKKIYQCIPSAEATDLEKQLNKMVWEAFGFSIEEVTR